MSENTLPEAHRLSDTAFPKPWSPPSLREISLAETRTGAKYDPTFEDAITYTNIPS